MKCGPDLWSHRYGSLVEKTTNVIQAPSIPHIDLDGLLAFTSAAIAVGFIRPMPGTANAQEPEFEMRPLLHFTSKNVSELMADQSEDVFLTDVEIPAPQR